MKKYFKMSISSLDIFDELTEPQIGRLFIAIRNFQNGKEKELDELTKIVFAPFKEQFLKDNAQYENISAKNTIKSHKRWGIVK